MSLAEFRRRGMDVTAQKRWNRRLDRYAAARRDGIRPKTTRSSDIETAERISDAIQQPFNGTSVFA